MRLHHDTTTNIVQKQLRFKFASNGYTFTVLILLQFFALLFSFPTMNGIYLGNYISFIDVSPSPHMIFTLLWAFFLGIRLASPLQWDEAFTFPSTRLTHQLSTLLFIFLASFIAAWMTSFIGPALRLLSHLRYEEVAVIGASIREEPTYFLLEWFTAFLYLLLVFLIGFTLRSILLASRGLGGVLLIVLIFVLFFTNILGGVPIVEYLFKALIDEQSLFIFILKILLVSAICIGTSIFMTNRLEVRK